jgi:hypothetical protein
VSHHSEELPIRIARRVRELTKLPHDLGKMPSIIEVRKLYEKSFFQIRKCPKPKTNEQEEKFTKILDDIMVAHNSGERQNSLLQGASCKPLENPSSPHFTRANHPSRCLSVVQPLVAIRDRWKGAWCACNTARKQIDPIEAALWDVIE